MLPIVPKCRTSNQETNTRLNGTFSPKRNLTRFLATFKHFTPHFSFFIVMATTSDIKKGMCIEFNGDIYAIIEFQHVKPGKGPAFVRTKLRSLTHGRVIDNTFPAGHKIDDVVVERRQYQFLYREGADFNFMNNDDFDQVVIKEAMIENPQFLKDGELVYIVFHAAKETPLACELPQSVWLTVTYVEPGVRGDTATNTLTPAKLETGADVRVPLFIKEGDKIRVDTSTGEYLEREKK